MCQMKAFVSVSPIARPNALQLVAIVLITALYFILCNIYFFSFPQGRLKLNYGLF